MTDSRTRPILPLSARVEKATKALDGFAAKKALPTLPANAIKRQMFGARASLKLAAESEAIFAENAATVVGIFPEAMLTRGLFKLRDELDEREAVSDAWQYLDSLAKGHQRITVQSDSGGFNFSLDPIRSFPTPIYNEITQVKGEVFAQTLMSVHETSKTAFYNFHQFAPEGAQIGVVRDLLENFMSMDDDLINARALLQSQIAEPSWSDRDKQLFRYAAEITNFAIGAEESRQSRQMEYAAKKFWTEFVKEADEEFFTLLGIKNSEPMTIAVAYCDLVAGIQKQPLRSELSL